MTTGPTGVGPGRGGLACSVVVGVGAGDEPTATLNALERQLGPDVEVIVVDNGGSAAYPPWVRRLSRSASLVPELWATGLAVATGRVVALTSAGLEPDPGWVARASALGDAEAAAIGGAVEPGRGLGMVDWARYFCRYAPYMVPVTGAARGGVHPAADNAAYRTDVLARYRHLWQDGFWEPFVHRAMVDDGQVLAMTDDLLVRQGGGARFGDFARQRYHHGVNHGELRSQGMSSRSIRLAALSAPAVPVVMTVRTARQVWARRRCRARFVGVLPITASFYAAWAAGEAVGRVRAAARRRTVTSTSSLA